jgi:hypothetical protein
LPSTSHARVSVSIARIPTNPGESP